MSFKTLLFVFTILNAKIFCLAENQSNCSCIGFLWEEFKFESVLSKDSQFQWKDQVCRVANSCIQSLATRSSSLFRNNKECSEQPLINVSFPVISQYPNLTFKRNLRPFLAEKEKNNAITTQVFEALRKIWKLFVFCLVAAALSGIIIWFFVSIQKFISFS